MTVSIITAGMLGSLYLATLMSCVLQELDAADAMNATFWAIALAFFSAFKTSLIVFFWLLVAITCLFAMLTPLFLSLYFCGFFN